MNAKKGLVLILGHVEIPTEVSNGNFLILIRIKLFYSTCGIGYQGDGFICSDINECAADENVCDEHGTSSNEVKSLIKAYGLSTNTSF